MNDTWDDNVRRVRGLWNGEADMKEEPVDLMVANAITSYLGGLLVHDTDIKKLAGDFECFLVDTTSAASAYVGPAEPDMRTVAFTVLSMMSRGGGVIRGPDDSEWMVSLVERFSSKADVCWLVLARCVKEGGMLLLVRKKVVQMWTCSGGVKDQCPAGIMQALEKFGVVNCAENTYNYAVLVPVELFEKAMNEGSCREEPPFL